MTARSSNISEFTVQQFMQYKSDSVIYWVSEGRHLHHLDKAELFTHQKKLFVKGTLPKVFQERFKTLSEKCRDLEELMAVFDSVVQYYKPSMSTVSVSKQKSKHNTTAVSTASPGTTSTGSAPAKSTVAPSQTAAVLSPSPQGGRSPQQPFGSNQKKSVKKVKKSHNPPALSSDDDDEVIQQGIFDTGSSVHTVPSASYLTNSVQSIDFSQDSLKAANDTCISVVGKGDSILSPDIPLTNALITPSITQPVLSPQLIIKDTNSSILLSDNNAYLVSNSVENCASVSNLINNSECIATIDPIDNLYKTPPLTSSNLTLPLLRLFQDDC